MVFLRSIVCPIEAKEVSKKKFDILKSFIDATVSKVAEIFKTMYIRKKIN